MYNPGKRTLSRTSDLVEISVLTVFILFALVFSVSKKFDYKIDIVIDPPLDDPIPVPPVVERPVRQQVHERYQIPVGIDPETEEGIDNSLIHIERPDFPINTEAPVIVFPGKTESQQPIDFVMVQEKPSIIVSTARQLQNYILSNYPVLAKKSGVSGHVDLRFVCSKEGVPVEIEIISESPRDMGFGEVAVKALEKLRFTPGMQRDKPVPVMMKQRIDFRTKAQ